MLFSGNVGNWGENTWAGFGFSLDERMGQDDLYFCSHFQDQSSFKSAVSYGRAPPNVWLPLTHIISYQADYKVYC